MTLLAPRETADVAVEHSTEGVTFGDRSPARFAMRRQPRRKATQLRHDYAVMARYQGEDPTDRQPLLDLPRQMPSGEEFGDLPVDRSHAAFFGRLEQSGPQYMAQRLLIPAGDLLQPEVSRIAPVAVQRISRSAGEELNRVKPSRGVQQVGFGDDRPLIGQLMFRVVFADKSAAG